MCSVAKFSGIQICSASLGCVTVGKWLALSGPWFPSVKPNDPGSSALAKKAALLAPGEVLGPPPILQGVCLASTTGPGARGSSPSSIDGEATDGGSGCWEAGAQPASTCSAHTTWHAGSLRAALRTLPPTPLGLASPHNPAPLLPMPDPCHLWAFARTVLPASHPSFSVPFASCIPRILHAQ